jgi:hypothetical protein
LHFAIVLIAKVLKLLSVLLCTFGHVHDEHVWKGACERRFNLIKGNLKTISLKAKLGKHTFSLLISQHAKMMPQPLEYLLSVSPWLSILLVQLTTKVNSLIFFGGLISWNVFEHHST